MTAMVGRALAYFVRREHCWFGPEGSDVWTIPRGMTPRAPSATAVKAAAIKEEAPAAAADARGGGDVVMADAATASVQSHPAADQLPTPSGARSGSGGIPGTPSATVRHSMHGAVLESLLLWLTLFRLVRISA